MAGADVAASKVRTGRQAQQCIPECVVDDQPGVVGSAAPRSLRPSADAWSSASLKGELGVDAHTFRWHREPRFDDPRGVTGERRRLVQAAPNRKS